MPAPKRKIPRRDAPTKVLDLYWRGDPPPKSVPSAADRSAYISAYYFAEDRAQFARDLGSDSFAASDNSAVDHPHHHAWNSWSNTK